MATGDLNDSIQESLDLVVSDGRLNDGTVVHQESDLDPTTTFFLSKIRMHLMLSTKIKQN